MDQTIAKKYYTGSPQPQLKDVTDTLRKDRGLAKNDFLVLACEQMKDIEKFNKVKRDSPSFDSFAQQLALWNCTEGSKTG